MRKTADYILLYFKGMAMGGADVIPGVSGGTVAFITGIYSELLHSIKQINADAVRLLIKLEFREFWRHINGSFLLTIVAGIFTSLLSLAKLMTYTLEHYPIAVWSFFFGLILISSPIILRDVKKWSPMTGVSFVVGIVAAYFITILSPAQTPDSYWFILLSGAIAICAMILPGISGAFILLLLGKYEFIIRSLLNGEVVIIIIFSLGCLIGLLTFSRVLSWIFDHYKYYAISLLAGFMLGSLNKVWPWKQITSFRINANGEQVPAFDKSVLPWEYFEVTGKDPLIFQAILMAALGIFIVVFVEKIAKRLKTKF